MIKLFKQWSSRKEIEELNSLKSKIYITQRWCAEFEQMYDVLKSTGVMTDPEQQMKIQQAMQDYEVKMSDIAAKQIESVNATMREESKSAHWIQFSWRPIIGFTFAAVIINNYIL